MMFLTENRAVNPLLKLEITLKAWAVVAGGLIMLGALSSEAMAADPLVLQNRETAVIDGRDWNKSFPNVRTADAVHRSLLLRFPGAAEQIAARLAQEGKIAKAEIVFEYEDIELQPGGYEVRGQLRDTVKKDPPRLHYVAWALRRPWCSAEGVPAPTFNAKRLLVFGMKSAPAVLLNGKAPAKALADVQVDGKPALAIILE